MWLSIFFYILKLCAVLYWRKSSPIAIEKTSCLIFTGQKTLQFLKKCSEELNSKQKVQYPRKKKRQERHNIKAVPLQHSKCFWYRLHLHSHAVRCMHWWQFRINWPFTNLPKMHLQPRVQSGIIVAVFDTKVRGWCSHALTLLMHTVYIRSGLACGAGVYICKK